MSSEEYHTYYEKDISHTHDLYDIFQPHIHKMLPEAHHFSVHWISRPEGAGGFLPVDMRSQEECIILAIARFFSFSFGLSFRKFVLNVPSIKPSESI